MDTYGWDYKKNSWNWNCCWTWSEGSIYIFQYTLFGELSETFPPPGVLGCESIIQIYLAHLEPSFHTWESYSFIFILDDDVRPMLKRTWAFALTAGCPQQPNLTGNLIEADISLLKTNKSQNL